MNAAWRNRLLGGAASVWLPVTVLVLWEVLASRGLLNTLFFPPPSSLAVSGAAMIRSGELGTQVGSTLFRMLAGSAMGIFCGLACGLLMGVARSFQSSLEPIISALNSTPKLALLPMLMLFTGVGETARLIPIALTSFVVVSIHALDAVRGVNKAYVELARNHGANRGALLRRVYLPASMPRVFTGLRLALGRGLVITISVELIGAQSGLGSMIWLAWQTFATDKLYVGVICAAALGAAFHNGLRVLEARLIPWGSAMERA